MRRLLFLPLAILLLGAAPTPTPRRIVSMNLCADQYLLALADRDQIAALTRLARDPEMSQMAAKAKGMPYTRGSAEEVLALNPDLIIGAPSLKRGGLQIPRKRNIATLALPPADSYAEIVEQVRTVATAVGHPERGAALIADMDRALAGIPATAGHGAVAAYYQRRGYLTGTGTLIDDLMRRVGLTNLAARLHKPIIATIGLEEMAVAHPDYLILESATGRVTDQGTEMLHHPILSAIPRLYLPQAWTVCGGPAYARAAQSLVRQLRESPPPPRR